MGSEMCIRDSRYNADNYNADNCDDDDDDDDDDDHDDDFDETHKQCFILFNCSLPREDRDDDDHHHLHHPPSRVSSTSELSLMIMMTMVNFS